MIGQRLKMLRVERGLTQAQLAKMLGVSPSAIGMYEQGRREPDNKTISRLALLFNVTTDFMLGVDHSPQMKQTKDFSDFLDDVRELMLNQRALLFNGTPISPKDKEQIIDALKIGAAIIIAKKNAENTEE